MMKSAHMNFMSSVMASAHERKCVSIELRAMEVCDGNGYGCEGDGGDGSGGDEGGPEEGGCEGSTGDEGGADEGGCEGSGSDEGSADEGGRRGPVWVNADALIMHSYLYLSLIHI